MGKWVGSVVELKEAWARLVALDGWMDGCHTFSVIRTPALLFLLIPSPTFFPLVPADDLPVLIENREGFCPLKRQFFLATVASVPPLCGNNRASERGLDQPDA